VQRVTRVACDGEIMRCGKRQRHSRAIIQVATRHLRAHSRARSGEESSFRTRRVKPQTHLPGTEAYSDHGVPFVISACERAVVAIDSQLQSACCRGIQNRSADISILEIGKGLDRRSPLMSGSRRIGRTWRNQERFQIELTSLGRHYYIGASPRA